MLVEPSISFGQYLRRIFSGASNWYISARSTTVALSVLLAKRGSAGVRINSGAGADR